MLETIRRFFEYVIRQRYPLLAFVFFSLWAPVSLLFLPSVLGNVLLVETYLQLGVFAFSTTLAVVFSVAIYRIIKYRLSTETELAGAVKLQTWASPILATMVVIASVLSPIVVFWHSVGNKISGEGDGTAFSISSESSWTTAFFWIVGGVACAFLLFAILAWIRTMVLGMTASQISYFPFEHQFDNRAKKEFRVVRFGKDFTPDVQLTFFLLIIALFYFFRLRPREEAVGEIWFSVPSYMVWMVWFATMIIAGLAYWLDKARIPTLLALIVFVIFVRGFGVDENFETIKPSNDISEIVTDWQDYQSANNSLVNPGLDSEKSDLDKLNDIDLARKRLENRAWRAIRKRMLLASPGPIQEPEDGGQVTDPGKSLVIVTCPGGGIHAAAWTSLVLEKLDRRYEGFADSIGLISGVSGGSVGTMFFAANRYLGETPRNEPLDNAWRQAAESSLEAISAGLAFDDFPAAFLPFFNRQDRGKRLENSFQARLPESAAEKSFGHWGRIAAQGQMPIVVLNATDAKTGRRILFDTLPTPPRRSHDGKVARPINYRELIRDPQENDIRAASAARCSATFPYVSPFVKPDEASDRGERIAIGDGGYVDNEGILTAIDWVDFISRKNSSEGASPFKRIVLVRIQPYQDIEVPNEDDGRGLADSLRWLTGPLEAIFKMRTTSQLERGQLESDLAATYIDNPWWEDAPLGDPTLPPAGAPSTDAMATNYQDQINRKRLSETVSKTKKSWFKGKAANSQKKLSDEPRSQAFVGRQLTSTIDAPVLTLTFPFIGEPDKVIPLNWKLSEKQKQAYPRAWKSLEESETTFFEQLDILFKKRKLNENPDEASLAIEP